MVLVQYDFVLLGVELYSIYRVSKGLLCLYKLKKVEIQSGVTIAGRTNNEQGKIELLSPWTMEG